MKLNDVGSLNNMKYVFHIFFLILFSVIQPTWLENAEIFGAKANLFLVYTIVTACCSSKKESSTIGFVFGLMLDILVGKNLGLNGILMMILAYFTTSFCESVIRKNTMLITIVIVGCASFLYELFYYIIAFLGNLEFVMVFVKVLLPETLCAVLATIPIYFIVRWEKRAWRNKGENIG